MPYPARDLDEKDLWLIRSMAESGKTITDVASAFHITEAQVWKFLTQRYNETLLEKFTSNQKTSLQ